MRAATILCEQTKENVYNSLCAGVTLYFQFLKINLIDIDIYKFQVENSKWQKKNVKVYCFSLGV